MPPHSPHVGWLRHTVVGDANAYAHIMDALLIEAWQYMPAGQVALAGSSCCVALTMQGRLLTSGHVGRVIAVRCTRTTTPADDVKLESRLASV